MQKLLSRINDVLSGLAGWLMFVMMALLVADVLWRVFSKPLLGVAEMSVFVMMIVIYLGFARCEEHEEHVRLEFLLNMARGRMRRAMILLTRVLALLTTALFVYAVFTDAWSAWLSNDSIEGMVNLPIWPTKFIMVVGAMIFLAQVAVNLFRLSIGGEATGEGSKGRVPGYE